jgi:hypothetical protein
MVIIITITITTTTTIIIIITQTHQRSDVSRALWHDPPPTRGTIHALQTL